MVDMELPGDSYKTRGDLESLAPDDVEILLGDSCANNGIEECGA